MAESKDLETRRHQEGICERKFPPYLGEEDAKHRLIKCPKKVGRRTGIQ
jgi:hypothetical protein